MSAPPGFSWPDELARLLDTQTAHFGEEVTYTPEVGDPLVVRAQPVDPARLEGLNPGQFAVRFVDLADFPAPPASGGTVTIGADDYRLFEVRAAGSGGAFLVLSKA